MTVYRTQPERTTHPTRPDWTRPEGSLQQPAGRAGQRAAVAFLVLLSVGVMCVAAFLFVRVFFAESLSGILPSLGVAAPAGTDLVSSLTALPSASATGGKIVLTLDPAQGAMGSLVTVTGRGWLPGEPVFVFLRPPDEPEGLGYSYAAAVADSSGNLRTAFTFPNELRWVGQPWADVTARGSRSGLQATVRFSLQPPSPTNTQLPIVRPSALPSSTAVPTPTATPTPTPVPIITDWRGEYFANPALSGSPALVRNDVGVSFDWGNDAPASGLPADGFSARWTRTLAFSAGLYRFTAGADDGVRLWVDGRLVVDEWHDGAFTLHVAELELSDGGHYLQLEYYENLGGARVLLAWEEMAPPTLTPTPTATPEPTPTPSPTEPPPTPSSYWLGEYYANPELTGTPVLVRQDAELDFDWGSGTPAEGVPADGFSIRWTQDAWLATGTYRISIEVDDGVRVWADGLLLIDEWHASGGAAYSATFIALEGMHSFRVEYLEDSGQARIWYGIEGSAGLHEISP